MKRILLFIFILTFVFAFSVISSAETYGELTYEISDELINITSCNSSATNIEIPSEINGCLVVNIDDNAFSYCENLISVAIADGVISIGSEAFKGCKNLKSVIIPDTVIMIGDGAFMGCNNLVRVIIPNSVLIIGDKAFGYNGNLNESKDVFIIYGYEGSMAEVYANKNYIPFLALKKQKSSETKEKDVDIKVVITEPPTEEQKEKNTDNEPIFLIVIIVLAVIIIALIVVLIAVMIKKKKN